MNVQIIPGITSHSRNGSTWRDKVEELLVLPIEQVALFVTGMSDDERIECYQLLHEVRKETFFTIPFVHAVSPMCEDEYWFLHKTFGTERFNLHPLREFPLQHYLSPEIRKLIYIENSFTQESLTEADLEGFAGICLDLAHYESMRRAKPAEAAKLLELVQQYDVGANHLSAIQDIPEINIPGEREYSSHLMGYECTLDFALTLPLNLFAPMCALELENPLSQQLSAIRELMAQTVAPVSRLAA